MHGIVLVFRRRQTACSERRVVVPVNRVRGRPVGQRVPVVRVKRVRVYEPRSCSHYY